MKSALLYLLLCCALAATPASCASTPPSQLALPGAQVRDGVRIEVTGIAGTWTRPRGLSGSVENVTQELIPYFYLRLDGLGYQGATVGQASTEIKDLAPGEKRRFRANFPLPAPYGLHQVMIGSVRVRR